MGIPVARLNHAVLYVRDATKAAEFYGRVFGFEVVESAFGPTLCRTTHFCRACRNPFEAFKPK